MAEWELRLQLKQPSPHVRAAVVRAVTQLHLQSFSRAVAEQVGDPDAEVCQALGAAVKLLPSVAEHARTALESEKGDEQLAGLRVLGAAGLPLESDVAHKLTSSARPEVRLAAAVALAPTDSDTAATVLTSLIDGPVDEAAIVALGKLATPRALETLKELVPQPLHSQQALAALAGSPAGDRLLLQWRLASSLPKTEGAAIDAALEADPGVPAVLVKLLGDPDEALARAAAARLGSRPAGIAALSHCLETLTAEAPRCATGLASSALAADQVRHALQSSDAHVRIQMLEGLTAVDQPPALALLSPVAGDPAEDVRAALAPALGRLGDGGIPLLTKLSRDLQDSVRKAAAKELVRLLPADRLHAFVAEAMSDPPLRSAVLTSTARLSNEDAIHLLVADLAAPDAPERRQAMKLLARYHATEATNALMDSAAKDSDPVLREYALTLLGNQ